MLSLIHEKLLEKKNKLETEVQTINNALKDLEKANTIYGVEKLTPESVERFGEVS